MKPTFTSDGGVSLININFNYMGAQGLTLALISAFLSGEICALFDRMGWTIKLKNVPAFMSAWFTNIFAGVVLIAGAWALVYVAGFDLMGWLARIIAPVLVVSDTLWSMMMWGALGALGFALGIHPAAVGGIFFPLFLTLAAENAELAAGGLAATAANGFHYATIGYVFALINIGGASATLGLNIDMLFSKKKAVKQLGGSAIVPSLFTVNEPLVFGLPIVFNPVLATGALLVNGVVNPLLAYIFFMTNLIPAATNAALIIFLPAPVVALLNNMGFRGFIASLVIIAVDCLVWLPFLRMHEKQLDLEETETEA
jgi:PTS system cellobiose-specific IIC component